MYNYSMCCLLPTYLGQLFLFHMEKKYRQTKIEILVIILVLCYYIPIFILLIIWTMSKNLSIPC